MGKGDALPLAVARFAEVYALQNDNDYRRLLDAIESGAIVARRDAD